MNKYLIPLLLGLASFYFATACKEYDELEGTRIITVSASFSDDATRADIEQAQGSLNLVTRWREDDKISLFLLQDGKGFTLEPVKVYDISDDGKRCAFDIRLPADISLDRSYDIYGLCDAEGVLWEEEGFVYAKSTLKRMHWNNRIVPMWFHEQGGRSNIQANFMHLGTYEILHVANTSKVGVTFKHDGFDVDEPWYKSSENTPLKDDYDPTQSVEEAGDDASSGSVFIAAGSTEKFLSWYVPRGGTIVDATLLATINGNSVRSANTKNSSVRIQRGHVYHMYATWDGNELKIADGGPVSGELVVDPIVEFGDIIVGKREYKYLTIQNNGTEDQIVQVAIEGYSSSSPFYLPNADWDTNIAEKVIPAGEHRSVEICFKASSLGDFNGNAIVTSAGLPDGMCIVPLHGQGVEEDKSFHLSSNDIEVYLHDNEVVDIYYGSGEYEVVNENPDVVDWDINGIHVAHAPATRTDSGNIRYNDLWWITGKKLGNATLRLTDKQTNEELTLHVKVVEAPSLLLAKDYVELATGDQDRVEILSGSGWYEVTVEDTAIATAYKSTISSGGSPGPYDDDMPQTGTYVTINALSVGHTTIRIKDMSSYEEATILVTVGGGVATPEIVDLGLSVKWASFNLGATKPEEFGDYYAWGEIEPYYSNQDPLTWKEGKESGYTWESYKLCMGNEASLTKYCYDSSFGYNGFTDNKIVLDPEDDAAHVNLGGLWRMPTVEEWFELESNCTWTWTTQNGVKGRLVMGSNGNSIFLPAAGHRQWILLHDVGSEGFYWSSSLGTEHPCSAWYDVADPYRSFYAYYIEQHRCYGFSIRPVYGEPASNPYGNPSDGGDDGPSGGDDGL